MKKFYSVLLLLLTLTLQAQNDTAKTWKIKDGASLNVHQNYFSNWAAGEENNFGPGFLFRPVKWFSVNLSPANLHWIIVDDQHLADGGFWIQLLTV